MADERIATDQMEDPPLPIMDHLQELRLRLRRIMIGLLAGFVACYNFAEDILNLLMYPLTSFLEQAGRGNMIFTGVTEPFIVQMKASFIVGLLLTLPWTCLQVYQFLKPAFRGREKAYFVWLFILGGALFTVGGAFGYFGVLPYGVSFLVGMGGAELLPQLSINEYFAFSVRLLFAFGIVFELPLAVLLLARLGLVDRNFFTRNRRYAIVIIFISAALLTPPDIMTQILLGLPLVVLYEVSAQLARLVGSRNEGDEDEEGEKDEDA